MTANREIRQALWSAYYHGLAVGSPRDGLLKFIDPTFAPIPLADAIAIVANAQDARALERCSRVMKTLGQAGFANTSAMSRVRAAALDAGRSEFSSRVDAVRAEMRQLVKRLGMEVPYVETVPPPKLSALIDSSLEALGAPCRVEEPSTLTVYTPYDPKTGRPLTTVTMMAKVPRTPPDLARLFDPRTWGECFDHFETRRVRPKDASGNYPDYGPDTDPIGAPWAASSAPHLFWERVTLETAAGTNVFENVLRIANFTVTPNSARLDFTLEQGVRLQMPAMPLDLHDCATIDEGHMSAVAITVNGETWSQVEAVKRLQFVDLTPYFYNPLGYDPGEILNYMAPASLTMWMDDQARGGACCPP